MPRRRSKVVSRIRGMQPSRRLLLVLAVLLLLSGSAALLSGATFTATSPGQVTVGAAEDYTPPTAVLTVPALVSGTVALTVDAQDARTAVTRVVIERRPAGSATWTTLCTTTVAPWTCAWDTSTEVDGDVSLRATATDSVGLSGTSAVATTRVANSPAVRLDPLPDAVRATFTATATVVGATGRTVSSSFDYRLAGSTGTWTTVPGCSAIAGTTPACAADTGTFTGAFEIRVVSTFAGGEVVRDVAVIQVDNTLPTASLTLPTPVSGTIVITPTVADAHSGVAAVTLEYRLGTGPWVTLCTREVSPYQCSLDTTLLVEGGVYEVRATVRDVAGNSASAAATTTVKNAASVSITAPGAGDLVWGVRPVEVAATAPSISSVTVQRRLKGAPSWVEVCVDTTAPYGCSWDTTALATGTYELRAVLAHGADQTLSSAVVDVVVGDPPLSAVDVQGTPGTGTRGLLDAGDRFTFTYSTVVDLATLRPGWDGSATQVTATLNPRNGTVANLHWLDLPGIGQLAFTQNISHASQSTSPIPVTLTARTVLVGGVARTEVTATMGAVPDKWLRTDTGVGTLRWTPTGGEKTPNGRAIDPGTASESGAADGDL